MNFNDGEFQRKLEEAIRLGFISRETNADGVVTYKLTSAGAMLWQQEKLSHFQAQMWTVKP